MMFGFEFYLLKYYSLQLFFYFAINHYKIYLLLFYLGFIMSDSGWDDDSSSSNQRGRGRGGNRGGSRGRGNFNNRNNGFDSHSQGDSWGNGGDSGANEWNTDDNGEHEGGSRGRGGRGGRGRGGRGGGRNVDRSNGDGGGDFGGDDQEPPVSDKPRPTYIPPEIDENDEYGIGVGINFNKYEKIQVKVSGDSVPKQPNTPNTK